LTDRLILTLALLGGTGNLGPGLALRWTKAGYRVIIGSRQAEKAQAVAEQLNTELGFPSIEGMENADALQNCDIGILTVNYSAHQEALESLKGEFKGRILVDATARVDFRDPRPPQAPSAGRIAKQILGDDARVVAAFQTVPAHAMRKNLGGTLDIDVLVCGDDSDAVGQVVKLVDGAGMRGYHAGGLDNAIVVEGLTALIIAMNKRYQSKTGAIKVAGIQR